MKRSSFRLFIAVTVILAFGPLPLFAQQPDSQAAVPRAMVVEVMYFKGRPLTYQRAGEWTWYGMFQRSGDWKPGEGEIPISAVKIASRVDGNVIKARVTLLRGKNHEIEDLVGDYSLSAERKTVVRELSDFGLEPFELQLVRAPATVAPAPTVVNNTRSLQVNVTPTQSSLPSFAARFLNNSAKPVLNFSFHTAVDEVKKGSASVQDEKGGILIKPGDTYERLVKYPLNSSAVSTGEVPPAVSGLVLNVTSVVFGDGSYEGNAGEAANFLAVKAGEKIQLQKFLEMARAKGFARTETEVAAAISSVNVDAVAADVAVRFPDLTSEDKRRLRSAVDFGKSVAVQFFRRMSSEPPAIVIERLQQRIDVLP